MSPRADPISDSKREPVKKAPIFTGLIIPFDDSKAAL
jgi:hypothetical protein